MAVNLNMVFSPILESSQPAFLYNNTEYIVNYRIPDMVDIQDIYHIDIRIVDQNSGQSIVNTKRYPDGIIYKSFDQVDYSRLQAVSINRNQDLANGHWKQGQYYKIQMRFGLQEFGANLFTDNTSISKFSSWKQEQVNNNWFSEWSTVMVVKAIDKPKVELINAQNQRTDSPIVTLGASGVEYIETPLFEGVYYIEGESKEQVEYYRFQLYDITSTEQLLEDSGWLPHDVSNDLQYAEEKTELYILNGQEQLKITSGDTYRFKTVMEYNATKPKSYRVKYFIKTANQYQSSADNYDFTIVRSYVDNVDESTTLVVVPNQEEGLNDLFFCNALYSQNKDDQYEKVTEVADMILSGNYVLLRSSEKTNYSVWEDLIYFNWIGEKIRGYGIKIFTDYTIESGVRYQYAFTKTNTNNIRKNKKESQIGTYINGKLDYNPLQRGGTVELNFQYCFLYDNNIQLKLKYDNTMNSFKHTTLANKQDTLGGKYPVIMRHGEAYYGEFPINGLISLHADEAQKFFTLQSNYDEINDNKKNGYYYKDELIIPLRKLNKNQTRRDTPSTKDLTVIENDTMYSFDTNSTNAVTFIERKYREKVDAFLNDGRYKLFKSPTEGNLIVNLINVQMTPNQQLGRLIYSFTSTAYETLEYNYENLVNYGIQYRGNIEQGVAEAEYVQGQVTTLTHDWGSDTNIYSKIIKPQSVAAPNKSLGNENFQYKIMKLNTIRIEPFPELALSQEINSISGEIHILQLENDQYGTNSERLNTLRDLETRLINLQEYQRNSSPTLNPIRFKIDNAEIVLGGTTQIYEIKNLDEIIDNSKWENFEIVQLQNTITVKNGEENKIIPLPLPPVIIDYVAELQLVENKKSVITNATSAMSWGQIHGIFTEHETYLQLQEGLDKSGDPRLESPIKVYDTLRITDEIEKKVINQIGGKYLKDPDLDPLEYFNAIEEDTGYYYHKATGELDVDGNIYFKILGYERIEIEADTGTILTIQSQTQQGVENRRVVIGPTNKYRISYTEVDNITDVYLGTPQQHKPSDENQVDIDDKVGAYLIVDFQAQIRIETRGVTE